MYISKEFLEDVVEELNDLILGYYATTNAQEGIPPLRMNWDFYAQLGEADKLAIFTARDDEDHNLLGFSMYILGNHPQHAGMPFALCNTLAVDPMYRNQGIGTLLVEAAISYFQGTDVKMLVHGHRTVYDATPLFPKLGFDLIEHIYMRMI
jgi:GNAT superfamily N-acetyltransferase